MVTLGGIDDRRCAPSRLTPAVEKVITGVGGHISRPGRSLPPLHQGRKRWERPMLAFTLHLDANGRCHRLQVGVIDLGRDDQCGPGHLLHPS